MSVRRFNGTTDELRCAIGGSDLTGPLTATVIARPQAADEGTFLSLWDKTTQRVAFGENASKQPRITVGETSASGGEIGFVPPTGEWMGFGYGKDAGSVPPSWHHYLFSENDWSHANDSTNLGNPVSQAEGTARLGAGSSLGFAQFDVAAVAVWTRLLSATEHEELLALPYLIDWLDTSPAGLWLFNQESVTEPVTDRTGNGADESSRTGTTVLADEPPIPYEAEAAVGKGSGSGAGSGSAKGTRGRQGKATGAGAGSGAASGTRGRQAKGTGSGAGSGSGSATRGRQATGAGSGTGGGTATATATPPLPVAAARVVSEPVDDALFVKLRHADGRTRWSGNEADASDIAQGIKISTSAPGGYRDASMQLLRDPRHDWPDLSLVDDIVIRGRTKPLGRNAFSGQAQHFPARLGDDYGIGVSAVGHQELLNEDETWRALYVRLGFEGWGEPPLWRRRELNAAGAPQGKFPPTIGNGGISWEVPTESLNNLETSEVWWEAPAGIRVSQLGYQGKQSGDTGKFETAFVRGIDSETTAVGEDKVEANLTLDDTPRLATFSVARRRLMLRMQVTTAGLPSSATQRSYGALAEYGDTGVPTREIAGALPGVYFHDALAHILATGAPDLRYTIRADGSIVPNVNFVMPDFAPVNPAPPREAIEKGNAYFLNNWAVWDEKTFFWHPWDPARLTWNASIAGGAHWAPVGRQAFTLINGIVVAYTDYAGVSRMAGPPGSGCDYEDPSLGDTDPNNPYTRRGRRRWARLDVGFPVAYPSTAFQIGSVVLGESKMPQRSGTLIVRPRGAGHVPSIAHPTIGPVPVWAMRAGEFVSLMDWPEPEPFRIIETDYDEASKTLTAQLDSGSSRLSAILERTGSRLTLI